MVTPVQPRITRANATGNHLLDSLPAEDMERLRPHLERVTLPLGEIIYHPDQPITHIFFPLDSVISLLAAMENGATVEAGVIGKEGIVGSSVLLGAEKCTYMALAQYEGAALRVRAGVLKDEFARGEMLQSLTLRFTNTLFTQVAQTAACNRLHHVEERLARWLLMSHDRIGENEFTLTQDFIARMLGVRRSGVTVAAGNLQRADLISYNRARIQITDRKGLECASCECYEAVKREYDRYLAGE